MKIERLERLHACSDAREWVKTQKSAVAAWENCERGDWMLWLAKKLNVDDRKLTMAKYRCASQVLHLMKDPHSLAAMAASLQYANGEITREELNAYAAATYAYAAADATYAAAAAAAYAAADADATYAAAAAAAAAAATYAARSESLKRSADICRQYLTEDVLAAYKKLK